MVASLLFLLVGCTLALVHLLSFSKQHSIVPLARSREVVRRFSVMVGLKIKNLDEKAATETIESEVILPKENRKKKLKAEEIKRVEREGKEMLPAICLFSCCETDLAFVRLNLDPPANIEEESCVRRRIHTSLV